MFLHKRFLSKKIRLVSQNVEFVHVSGRFEEGVIEERRQCAEDLLQFSANIPMLYNSKQLEDFFKVNLFQLACLIDYFISLYK